MVAKVEFHCAELFPRVGFIVTNLEMPINNAVESATVADVTYPVSYNKPGNSN